MNKDDVFQYLKENYDQLTESQKNNRKIRIR